MAKRQPKNKNQAEEFEKRRALIVKLLWAFVVIICVLFGYSYGYPIVAEGQPVKGILIGLAYGAGALMAILISFFLNQKLKGR
jgi:TRAP-type C4-dicarboxylate transport system permease small subunit